MKTVLAIISAALLSTSSFSQRIRFTDTTNRWSVWGNTNQGNYNYAYTYLGDTIINSKSYLKLSDKFVREDTTLRKVFIIPNFHFAGDTMTGERLLYDYNWQVGDTVINFYPTTFSFKYVVTVIDSTQIANQWYKVWKFENIMPLDSTYSTATQYYIIEGIGSTEGPWFSVYPMNFDYVFYLTCFSQNNISPTVNPPVPHTGISVFDNATSCTLKVTNVQNFPQTDVYPDPAQSVLNISADMPANSEIILSDILAKTILQTHFTNRALDISGLQSGLYFYQVRGNGQVKHGKFVKE